MGTLEQHQTAATTTRLIFNDDLTLLDALAPTTTCSTPGTPPAVGSCKAGGSGSSCCNTVTPPASTSCSDTALLWEQRKASKSAAACCAAVAAPMLCITQCKGQSVLAGSTPHQVLLLYKGADASADVPHTVYPMSPACALLHEQMMGCDGLPSWRQWLASPQLPSLFPWKQHWHQHLLQVAAASAR